MIGGLLINIACGLVYPILGPGRPFWIVLGVLFGVAATLALVRFIRNDRRSS